MTESPIEIPCFARRGEREAISSGRCINPSRHIAASAPRKDSGFLQDQDTGLRNGIKIKSAHSEENQYFRLMFVLYNPNITFLNWLHTFQNYLFFIIILVFVQVVCRFNVIEY